MVQILFPALAFVVGLLVYVLASQAPVKTVGLVMLACGFFFVTSVLAHESVSMFR